MISHRIAPVAAACILASVALALPVGAAHAEENPHNNASLGTQEDPLVFPGNAGPTRIHILSLAGADALLLESNGQFAMIDGGEDSEAPDGSDPRYPVRPGVASPNDGHTQRVLDYLDSHGVNSSNLAFYLGTHAHSDHISNAPAIIERYQPKVILSPEYSDEWITDPAGLWDNQFVYDRFMAAAERARHTYGAELIQHVNGYDTHIQLGDMDIQIIPFDPEENYKKYGTTDANNMGWGALVNAFGYRAFLSADLQDTESDWRTHNGIEDRVAAVVGHVDLFKVGHHGYSSSNFEPLMRALSPSVLVQTGQPWYIPDRFATSVIHGDTVWHSLGAEWSSAKIPALVATFSQEEGLTYTDMSAAQWGHEFSKEKPRAWWFQDGRPSVTYGWWKAPSGFWYFFQNSPVASTGWVRDRGAWYWMNDAGEMVTSSWVRDGESWYYVDNQGHMLRGGWHKIDGSWYYLTGSGQAMTGWMNDRGSWYYMDPQSAQMRTGWVKDGDTWYYLSSSGAMRTGWVRVGGAWYYLHASGAMAQGWLLDGGTWYWMIPGSGIMASGDVLTDDGRHLSRFSSSGAWQGYLS